MLKRAIHVRKRDLSVECGYASAGARSGCSSDWRLSADWARNAACRTSRHHLLSSAVPRVIADDRRMRRWSLPWPVRPLAEAWPARSRPWTRFPSGHLQMRGAAMAFDHVFVYNAP
jgi:hypothetical protein